MYWLGIDVGTGGTRALLVDRQGRVKAGVTAPLAEVGTGAYGSVSEVCHAAIREVDSTAPEPPQADLYARDHQVCRALYPAPRPLFPRM